jgi:Domain of unknown function (DUF362)
MNLMLDLSAAPLSLPRQLLVEARVPSHALAEPGAVVHARLAEVLSGDAIPGKRIAIAVGSRGIDRIGEVVRAIVGFIRGHGGMPFIVPAMGNHGGATAEGQTEVLDGLAVTTESVNAPIHASMETRCVGHTASGIPVYIAAEALDADGVVLVNRVKPHTDFDSTVIGSGLRKMAAIGLGKSEGAAACHRGGQRLGLERALLEVSNAVLGQLPILAAVGLVEDGRHQLSIAEVVPAAGINAAETALLTRALALMPALPFDRIDVLIIDSIGKDISGAGMDTNIIGRSVDGGARANRRSEVGAIYARRLTPASHGNAIGLGLADVVSDALMAAMDPQITYTNALSSMTPATAKLPLHFASDRACLGAAVRLSGADPANAAIVRIRSTLALDRFVASETYAPAIAARDDLRIVSEPVGWQFDERGDFPTVADLLAEESAAVSRS